MIHRPSRSWLIVGASLLLLLCFVERTFAQRTLEETARDARAAFVGKLLKATPRWGDASRSWLETEYEFAVEEAIVADERVQTGKKITFIRWGGEIGGRRQTLAGDPPFVAGNRYVLMLNDQYSKPECRQPLVERTAGWFAVARRDGEEVVVDHRGEPVVLAGNRLVRHGELAGGKVVPELVSAATFAKTLKADLARIQSLPRIARVAPARARDAKSQYRPRAKLGIRRDVSSLKPIAPRALVVKGVQEPTPTSNRTYHLADARAVAYRGARTEVAYEFTGETAALPLTFNQLPDSIAMAGVDVNCMILWNHYFPNTFRTYAEPLPDVGFGDGVSDVWGFFTEDDVVAETGAAFDGYEYNVYWWVNLDTGKIDEADIFFNAEYEWTADDTAVFNGADNRVSFRRMMMQALGVAVGLDYSPQLALMSLTEPLYFEGINQPQGDDLWGLDELYPRSNSGDADLLVTLASSPEPHEWVEASFSATAKAGGEITVGGYFLCNVGVAAAEAPKIDWYLCRAQHWDDTYVHLGSTTYPALQPNNWFVVNDKIQRTLTVPEDTPPGEYFLAAFIPGESNFSVQGFFPFSVNSSFSRSKITITKE